MSKDLKHLKDFLQGLPHTTKFTIWNEIDERVYEGTPDFDTREEAKAWWEKNDGRPSSVVIKRTTFIKNKP